MNKVYLGLGSNIGDSLKYLNDAILLLSQNNGINILKESKVYKTEPIGYKDQNYFLNKVIEIKTIYKPQDLLKEINNIEHLLDRKRDIRWGPRTIDIDILLYEDLIIKNDNLIIPHLRMKERKFVLVPLKEIAGDIKLDDINISRYINALSEQSIKEL